MTRSEQELQRLVLPAAIFVAVGSLATIALEFGAGRPDEAIFSIALLTFPAVGFFILSRRPAARLGWLMVSMGLMLALPFTAYGAFAIKHDLPLGPLALALGDPGWVPFIGISGFLLLLFPDGHLPSPRWRWFAWACGISLVLVAVGIWFIPGPFKDSGFPDVVNPLGIAALEPLLEYLGFFILAAPILVLGGAAGLIVRMRRTTDDVVRHQIRWLAYVAAWIAVIFGLAFLPTLGNEAEWTSWIQQIGAASFMLIPITIGVAVLRYRLYDIDVVIRKTLVFAAMAAVIAAVYVGVVVGVGALVGSTGSPVLSAVAAAVVALVFQPVRARARRFADRVVYGSRASPYELLSEFSHRVSSTYAADDVLPRMARLVAEGLGAERAQVWLRSDGSLRVTASWPTDLDRPVPVTIGDDEALPALPGSTSAFRVEHYGELLGALGVAMPPNDPMDPTKAKLMDDLASQAGLVLHNVRLTAELQARLDDLRAAQKRLVAAQDDERRKLERNIHDGAQQQLVALTVKLRLAQSMVGKEPGRAESMLADLQTDTQSALEDLRDLARGIYPPLLADKGLAAALESQLRKSTVPANLHADGIGRYPQDIEAAVYFSCLEALQNAAKYAPSSAVVVDLRDDGTSLEFSVKDDGDGFDPAEVGYGTGLQGIADRLGAIDGRVRVDSAPGRGTTVVGEVPSGSRMPELVSPGVSS